MKAFHIFNKELEIESGLLLFAILREKINTFAIEAADEFDTFYGSCANMKYFLEHAESEAQDLYTQYMEETASFLIKLNIYDISSLDIQKRIRSYTFPGIYDELYDWYINQLQNEAQKDQYRTLRRQTRNRWVGGGFGLTGAVSGAVQAGLLNMASGTVHGAVNVVGKGISSLGAAVSETAKFHNPALRNEFCKAINDDVYQILDVVSDMLNDYFSDFTSISLEDTAKANQLFKTLSTQSLSQEQQYDIAFRLFFLDPFQITYYKYCVIHYPSQQKALIALGKYCKLDMDECILSVFQNIFDTMPHNTEENTLLMHATLLEKQSELEVDTNSVIQKTEKILHDFDIAARTFQNVLYETRDLRAKAEKDFNFLTELCADLSSADENECNQKN